MGGGAEGQDRNEAPGLNKEEIETLLKNVFVLVPEREITKCFRQRMLWTSLPDLSGHHHESAHDFYRQLS